jgi:hypothetical protein
MFHMVINYFAIDIAVLSIPYRVGTGIFPNWEMARVERNQYWHWVIVHEAWLVVTSNDSR